MSLLAVSIFSACFLTKEEPDTDDDGDGLLLSQEEELGTDPNAVDSDGDTYEDGWEVTEGTDPTDADSRIYEGYWPYNPDKDLMVDPGLEEGDRAGDFMPRFVLVDQFGDEVDLYDFAGQGKPIIFDLSGEWCGYCNELAAMLEGQDNYFDDYADYYSWVEGLAPLVEDGTVYWITVLDSDWNGASIDEDEVEEWYDRYPHEQIPVLGDVDLEVQGWMDPNGWPTLMLVDESMEILMHPRMYTDVLDEVMASYG